MPAAVHSRLTIALLALAAACLAAMGGSATGATSGTVVGATVPSAISLDTTTCTSSAATDFGAVTPGSAVRTTGDCVVTWGSSNNTSQLLVRQADATGDAMYRLSSGAIQSTWGATGVRTFDLGGTDKPYAVATMQDGGTAIVSDVTTGTTPTMLRLIRLTPAGAVDAAFGTVILPIRDGSDAAVDGLGSMIVDSAGRIVIVGTTPALDTTILRYNANGTPDTTFGTGGVVSVNVPGVADDDRGTGIVELRDGDYLSVGYSFVGAQTDGSAVRVRSDGSLETAFGGGDGIVTVNLGAGGNTEGLLDAAELDDGTLYLSGGSLAAGGEYAIVKMSAAGVPDPAFGGGDGVANVSGVSALGAFTDIAPLPGNKLVALALSSTGTVSVTRLNLTAATATVDTTFGTSGLATVGFSGSWSSARMSVSKSTVTATAGVVSGDRDTVVKRFLLSDGSADTSFASTGTYTNDMAPGQTDQGSFISEGPDGRLVLLGYTGTSVDGFALRLDSESLLAYDDVANRDWATAGTQFFGVCLSGVTSATATWTASAGCPTSDGLWWRAMPTANSQVATTAANVTGATATFRFGMRVPNSQTPGAYEAPITFTALAP